MATTSSKNYYLSRNLQTAEAIASFKVPQSQQYANPVGFTITKSYLDKLSADRSAYSNTIPNAVFEGNKPQGGSIFSPLTSWLMRSAVPESTVRMFANADVVRAQQPNASLQSIANQAAQMTRDQSKQMGLKGWQPSGFFGVGLALQAQRAQYNYDKSWIGTNPIAMGFI